MITQKSGMSIALVVVVIAGIISNVHMMNLLHNDVNLVRNDVAHIVKEVNAIRTYNSEISNKTSSEIELIQHELNSVNLKLVRLEGYHE